MTLSYKQADVTTSIEMQVQHTFTLSTHRNKPTGHGGNDVHVSSETNKQNKNQRHGISLYRRARGKVGNFRGERVKVGGGGGREREMGWGESTRERWGGER